MHGAQGMGPRYNVWSHMQGQGAEEVDRCSVLLQLRNEAYNALMAKHQALQQDHRASQCELRVRDPCPIRTCTSPRVCSASSSPAHHVPVCSIQPGA